MSLQSWAACAVVKAVNFVPEGTLVVKAPPLAERPPLPLPEAPPLPVLPPLPPAPLLLPQPASATIAITPASPRPLHCIGDDRRQRVSGGRRPPGFACSRCDQRASAARRASSFRSAAVSAPARARPA